jgi:hypothetical protein
MPRLLFVLMILRGGIAELPNCRMATYQIIVDVIPNEVRVLLYPPDAD